MPHVAVTIVAWNSMKYLPEALASLSAQTYRDLTVIVVDNASTDGIAQYVREHHPGVVLLRNSANLGFARGQNQGIAYAKAHLKPAAGELFVLVTNPDVILEPDYIETMLDHVSRRPEVGSAAGILLKAHERADGELRETVRTDVIDSTGMRVHKNRRFVERGAGETLDEARYGRTEEVFGVSGALALYRMNALDDVADGGQWFDEDFFVYKEDVDLAWRLRLRGWSALFVPRARAYHHRTAASDERTTLGGLLRGRRGRSKAVNYFSYRNHLLTVLKNDHARNLALDLPRVAWYEVGKFAYLLLLEPSTLKAVPSVVGSLPKTLAKRRRAMKAARANAADIRKWFT